MPRKTEKRLCVFCHNSVEEFRVKTLDAHCCGSCASRGKIVRFCLGCKTLVEQERIAMLDASTCSGCAHIKEAEYGGIKTIFANGNNRLRQIELWEQRQDRPHVIVPFDNGKKNWAAKKLKKKLPPVLMTEILDD